MGKTVRVGADISEDLNASLERLASERGQPKDLLVEQVLRDFIRSEEEFVLAVREGVEAWKAGDMVEHATMIREFERRYGRAE
jgi:predicted transcriptional regulator